MSSEPVPIPGALSHLFRNQHLNLPNASFLSRQTQTTTNMRRYLSSIYIPVPNHNIEILSDYDKNLINNVIDEINNIHIKRNQTLEEINTNYNSLIYNINESSNEMINDLKSKVRSILMIPIKLQWKYDLDTICTICFEEVSPINGGYLNCNHVYHNQCIHEWRIKTNDCPQCKKCIS